MYLIKQYLITNKAIRKIINYIIQSNKNAYQIGLEFSLLYYFLYEEKQKNDKENINIIINNFLLNTSDSDKIKIKEYLVPSINYYKFFTKFNKKLFKLKKDTLSSFFRGYYINVLNLYGTNIMISKILDGKYQIINEDYIYFVLYDFHNLYLDFIYSNILNLTKFPCKIKYLISTEYDKYSINEITDDINYRLVFIHKKKYYNNSIKLILNYLFMNIKYESQLYNLDEINIYRILQIL
jgi:hypothetical protein